MGDNQCRLIQFGNNIRHSKGLTRTCYSKKRLKLIPFLKAIYKIIYSFRLVTSRRKFTMKFKYLLSRHTNPPKTILIVISTFPYRITKKLFCPHNLEHLFVLQIPFIKKSKVFSKTLAFLTLFPIWFLVLMCIILHFLAILFQ